MHVQIKQAKLAALALTAAVGLFSNLACAKDWKTATIALEGGYEPWNMTRSDGTLFGFEPELAADLCARAQIKCKLIAQDWDGMMAALKVGKFDVIMDGLAITDDRKREILFSVPYANTPAVFAATRSGSLHNLPGTGSSITLTGNPAADKAQLEPLRRALKGKVIGIVSGISFTKFIYSNFGDVATIREYKTAAEHDLDLENGRIDVVFDDATYFSSVFAKSENKDLTFSGPMMKGQVFGPGEALGFRLSDPDLKAKFDGAIKSALADGTVKRLSEKWFKTNVAP
ncbi:transporter substrate-binding domain-containing protein [Paraburkholderia sp. J67]|uniref:transporter substrate-binding domain-containing protein n=1 Tax=Paraburkholderia sp. J67 TaxID=2805435 RepID=UPI002ABDB647|nr:transporter substrate-binding domain-containing protein [Paraburkholderia sp. J67]